MSRSKSLSIAAPAPRMVCAYLSRLMRWSLERNGEGGTGSAMLVVDDGHYLPPRRSRQ